MDANGSAISPVSSSGLAMRNGPDERPALRRGPIKARRTGIVLKPNNSRVVIRPFEPTNANRKERIVARIMSLSEEEVERLLEGVMREFRSRHRTLWMSSYTGLNKSRTIS